MNELILDARVIDSPPPNVSALSDAELQRKAAWLAAYREMLDWIEAAPNLPAPSGYNTYNIFASDKARMIAMRRGAGVMEKVWQDSYFILRRTFGATSYGGYVAQVDLNISREQVCKKVVVGTKVIPATPEREVEIVEWVCEEAPQLESQKRIEQ